MPASTIIPQHHPFVKTVARALRRRCGVEGGSTILAAVSGGADSVALIRILASLGPRRRWRLNLIIGHVQHHLRSNHDAEGDARFVEELAARLELPFIRSDLDLSGRSGNVEANARRARYNALSEMARDVNAAFVATAHHGDDQLETLLMRMLRGASVRGLAGMAWRRRLHREGDVWLIRPMLAVDRWSILAFLNDLDQPWRQDHTNADMTRLRAHLRHKVLPSLHAVNEKVAQRAVATADHLRGIAELLDQTVSLAADRVVRDKKSLMINRAEMRTQSQAVLLSLLRRLLIEAGVGPDSVSRRTLYRIVAAIQDQQGGDRRFDFSGGVIVAIDRDTVRIKVRQ